MPGPYELKSTERNQVDKYTLRFNRYNWLLVYVDSESGVLSIVSDWGNWSYRWGAPGKDLKAFLIGCDKNYVKGKLSDRTYFNFQASVKEIKKDICERRRSGEVSKEEALECWEQITSMDETNSVDGFFHQFCDQCGDIADQIYGGDISGVRTIMEYPPVLENFMENVWPQFIEVLREELGSPPA